jgi:hypothetical protein
MAKGPNIFLSLQVLQLMNDSNQSVRDAAISCIEVSWFHIPCCIDLFQHFSFTIYFILHDCMLTISLLFFHYRRCTSTWVRNFMKSCSVIICLLTWYFYCYNLLSIVELGNLLLRSLYSFYAANEQSLTLNCFIWCLQVKEINSRLERIEPKVRSSDTAMQYKAAESRSVSANPKRGSPRTKSLPRESTLFGGNFVLSTWGFECSFTGLWVQAWS